jgi:hypothetical protein
VYSKEDVNGPVRDTFSCNRRYEIVYYVSLWILVCNSIALQSDGEHRGDRRSKTPDTGKRLS